MDGSDSEDQKDKRYIVNTLSTLEAVSRAGSLKNRFSSHHNSSLNEVLDHRRMNEGGEIIYEISNKDGEMLASLQLFYTEEHWNSYKPINGVLETKNNILKEVVSAEVFKEIVDTYGSGFTSPQTEERNVEIQIAPFPADQLEYQRWVGEYLTTISLLPLIARGFYRAPQVESVEDFEDEITGLEEEESSLDREILKEAMEIQV